MSDHAKVPIDVIVTLIQKICLRHTNEISLVPEKFLG